MCLSAASGFECNNGTINLESGLLHVESFVCKTAGAVQALAACWHELWHDKFRQWSVEISMEQCEWNNVHYQHVFSSWASNLPQLLKLPFAISCSRFLRWTGWLDSHLHFVFEHLPSPQPEDRAAYFTQRSKGWVQSSELYRFQQFQSSTCLAIHW